MTTLLTVQTYPAIRAALGVLVDSNLLPDSTIQLDLYAGRAQAWVEASDPAWATRTGADRQHLVNAAVLRCAGLLATAMPAFSGESSTASEYSYSVKPVDWAARAAALMADAEEELQLVIAGSDTEAATANMPTFFTSAKPYTPSGLVGGRGR